MSLRLRFESRSKRDHVATTSTRSPAVDDSFSLAIFLPLFACPYAPFCVSSLGLSLIFRGGSQSTCFRSACLIMGILHSKFRSQSTSSSPTRFRNPFVFHTFRDMSCFAVLVFLLVSPRGLGHFVRSTRIDFIVHDIVRTLIHLSTHQPVDYLASKFNSDSWKRLEARFNDTAGTGLGLGDMQAAVTFTLLATTMIFIPLRILRALYAFIFIPVLRRLSFGLARFFSRRSSTRADIYTALKSSEVCPTFIPRKPCFWLQLIDLNPAVHATGRERNS